MSVDIRPRAKAACPHDCPSACALEVEQAAPDRIGRVYGRRDHPYTAGVICEKVARYAERVHHPDRLRTPLLRVGAKGDPDGFIPIGWDEALDHVADGLRAAEDAHGREAVWPYYYAGTMGLVQRDGINRLRHVMRWSGQHRTICSSLSNAGWAAGAGSQRGADAREMAQSDLILVWGCNAATTQLHVLTHANKARKARCAKIVCVDPYRNRTAASADWHIPLKPGTDGALACGVMAALFENGGADRGFMARFTDDPAGLEAHLRHRSPDWASAICGVPAADIRALADLMKQRPRCFLRIGYGLTRSRNGAAQMHAVASIAAVAGSWAHAGGGALYSQSGVFGVDKTLIEGADRRDRSVRVLDMSRIGPILCGDPADLGDGPPVKALFIQNTNPMVVAPESLKVRDGFARDDLFVCVHEQFMTETAAMADVV
ncbi:MAG: molybdopterin-dependent oxidoreductase, partial [Pseudomonadota bacterium]